MSDVTKETITEAMYAMVKESEGKKKFKPMDLTKAMMEQYGCGIMIIWKNQLL